MALDDDCDAGPYAKRQRRREGRDDGQDDEGGISFDGSISRHRQRTAYEEDAARIRSAMMTAAPCTAGAVGDDEA